MTLTLLVDVATLAATPAAPITLRRQSLCNEFTPPRS
jgi:hypothetical protein